MRHVKSEALTSPPRNVDERWPLRLLRFFLLSETLMRWFFCLCVGFLGFGKFFKGGLNWLYGFVFAL